MARADRQRHSLLSSCWAPETDAIEPPTPRLFGAPADATLGVLYLDGIAAARMN